MWLRKRELVQTVLRRRAPVVEPKRSMRNLFEAAAQTLLRSAQEHYVASAAEAVTTICQAFRAGRTLYVFGNGGSAADAQHIAGELAGRFLVSRPPLAAVALGTNAAFTTAWSNDEDFSGIFERELAGLAKPGDVAWGISTSGNSPNVVRALRCGRERGLRTIGLTGAGGGKAAEWCDILMAADSSETPRIQEVHVVTYHAICAEVERQLFG